MSGGFSIKVSFLEHLFEETQIRIDNKQKEAIGPFLDRQIALDMQKKIKKNTSINVTIQEIVSQ